MHEDKHQAPTLPHIRPLSLQDPMRSSAFIRRGFPDLVVNIHQVEAAFPALSRFGC